ncbi:NAD(P)-dependent oxidoreductase [Streptomyces carminius]|uniref:NAD(P)-dependent oxidoreductase n=1 Tax=Streptomyces carminius TaxID=2665496 RepID=A0A2M8LVE8_9ACTN|nr:SDR family oxidoreductase [Streptomyces carminius]PJE95926.1 NAD(P)-dependent oxidoreductase [Streptomyces carminius]
MIVVTGAAGQLGRLTVEALLELGVPASEVVAAVRSPEKAADLAGRGVQVREADYDRPGTLAAAFEGARRVLLVSGSEVGRRVPQHRAVVDAAKAAGAELLAYTSVLHADTTTVPVAPEHRETEEYLRGSGLPHCLLRNGWYTENYEQAARQGLEAGVIAGAAGDGRIASASRADYAEAAAAVLAAEDASAHAGAVYELSGDTAWTMADFAATLTDLTGTEVVYRDLSADGYVKALTGAGLPEGTAHFLADTDASIATGHLADTPGDLSRLIGRPTTPLRDVLAPVVRS